MCADYGARFAVINSSPSAAYTNELSSNRFTANGQQPLAFTGNKGQWDERVKFRGNAGGAAMWFTTDGIYYRSLGTSANPMVPRIMPARV